MQSIYKIKILNSALPEENAAPIKVKRLNTQ